MRCDTCRREVPEVSRVVICVGYNRVNTRAVYNCPECFAKKEKTKTYSASGSDPDGIRHQEEFHVPPRR